MGGADPVGMKGSLLDILCPRTKLDGVSSRVGGGGDEVGECGSGASAGGMHQSGVERGVVVHGAGEEGGSRGVEGEWRRRGDWGWGLVGVRAGHGGGVEGEVERGEGVGGGGGGVRASARDWGEGLSGRGNEPSYFLKGVSEGGFDK